MCIVGVQSGVLNAVILEAHRSLQVCIVGVRVLVDSAGMCTPVILEEHRSLNLRVVVTMLAVDGLRG